MLTQERLKEVLNYDPETGVFTWKNPSKYKTQLRGKNASWKTHGYTKIGIDGKRHYAHRLAWLYVYGEWPSDEVDHIDRDRSNNRIKNLRCVSRSINTFNSGKRKDNTSGARGVCWDKSRDRWLARLRSKHIGYFKDFDAAVAARKQAELSDSDFLTATA